MQTLSAGSLSTVFDAGLEDTAGTTATAGTASTTITTATASTATSASHLQIRKAESFILNPVQISNLLDRVGVVER